MIFSLCACQLSFSFWEGLALLVRRLQNAKYILTTGGNSFASERPWLPWRRYYY